MCAGRQNCAGVAQPEEADADHRGDSISPLRFGGRMSTFHHRPTPLVSPQACARPRRSWLPRWLKRSPPRAAAPPQRYLAEAITPYLAPDAGMSVGTLYTVRPCSLEAIRYRFPNFPAGGKIEYWTELCVAVCDEGVVALLRPERPIARRARRRRARRGTSGPSRALGVLPLWPPSRRVDVPRAGLRHGGRGPPVHGSQTRRRRPRSGRPTPRNSRLA